MLVKINEVNGKIETIALLDCNYIGRTSDGRLKLIAKGDTIFKYTSVINITIQELEQIIDFFNKKDREDLIKDLTKYIFEKERQVKKY